MTSRPIPGTGTAVHVQNAEANLGPAVSYKSTLAHYLSVLD